MRRKVRKDERFRVELDGRDNWFVKFWKAFREGLRRGLKVEK